MNIVQEPLAPYIEKYTAEPKEKIYFLLEKLRLNKANAWIAGGFLRRIIANESVSEGDVDIYFLSGYHATSFMRKHCDTEWVYKNNSRLHTRYDFTLNAVTYGFFKDPEHILDSFDFTIVCMATDGTILWRHEDALTHIQDKVLEVSCPAARYFVDTTRIFKYTEKGYWPPKMDDPYNQIAYLIKKTYLDVSKGIIMYPHKTTDWYRRTFGLEPKAVS